MIEGDQHFHIIEFHPQINYLPGTNNGRAVCAWISSYKELKPTWNPVECHYFTRTLHHLYSRYRCHRCLPDYSCNFVDVTSELVWRPIICSWFEGGINYGWVEDSSLHHVSSCRTESRREYPGLNRVTSGSNLEAVQASTACQIWLHLPLTRTPAELDSWLKWHVDLCAVYGTRYKLRTIAVRVYPAFVLYSLHFLNRGWDGPDDEGWPYPGRNRDGTLFIELFPRQIRTIFQRLSGDANHWVS